MNNVLLVTGGSRGIGAATARLAAERGYAVCVNFRSREAEASEVVSDVVSAGGRAGAVQADLAKEPDVLLSDEASFTTGATLDVAGGR